MPTPQKKRCMSECVCERERGVVCVKEREKERERQRESDGEQVGPAG